MIASRRSVAALGLALLACGAFTACRTPSAPPIGAVVEREVRLSALVPDVVDHVAADLAAAALVSDRERAARAVESLRSIDVALRAAEEPATGLVPVGTDLLNTTLDDPRAYRTASRELMRRDDLDRALRTRLDQFVRDDYLHLANARIRDAWLLEFGRAFNALAEPLGKSIMSHSMAPYRIGRSLIKYAAALYARDPLPLQRRQALAHWTSFLTRHPDAPEAESLIPRVNKAKALWHRTRYDHALQAAQRALGRGQTRVALIQADRALHHVPEDRSASELRDRAEERLLGERGNLRRSVQGSTQASSSVVPAQARPLTLALLDPAGDVEAAALALQRSDRDGPLADEARFAAAMARGEAGGDSAMWADLEELAERDPAESNMARHAAALVYNPARNAYAAFERAKGRELKQRLLWVLLGPYSKGLPERRIPKPLAWSMDLPAVAQSMIGAPLRAIQLPWSPAPPASRSVAVSAKRYLARHPNGEHAEELRDWLESFEAGRGNWLGAYRVAEKRPGVDEERLAELREKAARQSLKLAQREKRRDVRNTMYRHLTREFPETLAGRTAGQRARTEVENATPQHIRIRRSFLLENPEFAGPKGLGLSPHLLDENTANGELHPDGVALAGGRALEVSYVARSGDEDDPPLRSFQMISEERLARLVSQLEETSFRNSLEDSLDQLGSDAHRDVFFERARIGLADEVDPRALA
ncbi:MAG: hypothetical protein V3U03_17160, partial [Myxococcota bacterium]